MISITRYHDISCGHRVYGHEGKCRGLHGHNYRIHFTCTAVALDDIGRVIDFSVIKERLCEWLELHWDHKMLLWEEDPLLTYIQKLTAHSDYRDIFQGCIAVPFNPTAENMAQWLLTVLGPRALADTCVTLTEGALMRRENAALSPVYKRSR